MAISTTLRIAFDGKQVQRGLANMSSSVADIGKKFAKIGIGTLAAGVTAAAAGFVVFAKGASESAAGVESLTSQFETLLGSAGAAEERMAEITKFAADTPFEIEGLSKTSKLLQTLGGSLLATGSGLRMVGDAAALAGQPLEEVGLHVGRIFNAITSGTSAGESVNRLQELGLITGKVKKQFEDLAEAQKKGNTATLSSESALKLLQGVLASSSGAMERLSKTTEGKLSNLADNITQLKVAFGKGFNSGIRNAADAVNVELPKMLEAFRSFGVSVGNAISDGVNGNFDKLAAVGKLIGDVISAAAIAAFQTGIVGINQQVQKILEDINPIRRGLEAVGVDAARGSQYGSTDFKDALDAQLILKGIAQQVKDVASGTQGIVSGTGGRFRYAKPGESSTLTDANGVKVVEVLKKIEKNTSGGAKM